MPLQVHITLNTGVITPVFNVICIVTKSKVIISKVNISIVVVLFCLFVSDERIKKFYDIQTWFRRMEAELMDRCLNFSFFVVDENKLARLWLVILFSIVLVL
jgi:hypothetical protein